MSRRATCRACGADFITPSNTGRLPLRCSTCQPGTASRYRTEVLELRARVATLDALLADEVQFVAGADRRMVVAAVRHLGLAAGRKDTIAALVHLRDVTASWAVILRGDGALPHEQREAA